jgi:hypothetical protein
MLMKTPEEIKKGLDVCGTLDGDCENCPYDGLQIFCGDRLRKDALAYIQQLESRLAHVERERDAAVEDLKGSSWCEDCRHYKVDAKKEPCKTCLKNNMKTLWQWRGVCPENTKEDSK